MRTYTRKALEALDDEALVDAFWKTVEERMRYLGRGSVDEETMDGFDSQVRLMRKVLLERLRRKSVTSEGQ